MYIELHARSAFSFLQGAVLPDALAYGCVQLELPGMALVDRNSVSGAPFFHQSMTNNKLKAHVGAEIGLAESGSWLPVLPATQAGYKNLCRLITAIKLRTSKNIPATATFPELEQFAGGCICLTGDEDGPLAHALRRGGKEEGRRLLERLKFIFGAENVYVEIQRHFRPEQEQRNQIAVELGTELKLPLLATNGVLYATPEDREVLDVFTALHHKCNLDTAGRLLSLNAERHIRTGAQMAEIFRDLPQAIANTVELSSRLEFTLKNLGYEFPPYPVPDGGTQIDFLRSKTQEGARDRYRPATDRARRQIERELALIGKLNLAGYFLIVWDIIRFCRENHILVQGRGSAANSAVCYALGITAIDPIAMGLLFERFLSEERHEWPDIDLDLPSGDDREKVIQYVYNRYGQRGAAMTANVITYGSRLASREVGKVLGFDARTLDLLSSVLGSWEWKDPDETLERQVGRAGLDMNHPRIRWLISLCSRIRGLPRHLGQHSGGMIVCQGMLDAVVPLEPATMPGRVVCQWDKEAAEITGLIKIDLLGLGALGAVRDCIDLIDHHYDDKVDLAHLPQDPEVYEVICKADTVGLFQIESRAQMASLPRNSPRCFYDLVTQVALIRPGPIVGQMTNPYLNRRQGKELVTYPHPSLEPVLERTLGVPLFQEQLLRMAMLCANFTGGEAEELRRALGHKRSEQRMVAIEAKLRAGMAQNGIVGKGQDDIVKFITSFALYGFPESHSASFALIAYATAFLKVHYLAAYAAALLNNQPMGFYSAATLVQDARRHGLKFLPVTVTKSDWNCTLEKIETEPEQKNKGLALRVGLRYVRSLQQRTAEHIVAERKLRCFTSIADLCRRTPELNKTELRMLAVCGALADISGPHPHRRDALWQVQKYGGWKQHPLLEKASEAGAEEDLSSPLARMNIEERLIADYHSTGLTLGPHPMAYKRKDLHGTGIRTAAELARMRHGEFAITGGQVDTRQRPGTAKGIMFISLLDETGFSNVVVMPDVLKKYWTIACTNRFLKIEGTVENVDGVVHLKAQRIMPLEISAAQIESHNFH
ncbi:MAG TPA: error-prone DNA polymerase [Candidatus Angelobacter sp.]|jgi:error-prone DNA polymerase|nr:error-prone DNA polymerase [Candidatus Angelobacter sp.]